MHSSVVVVVVVVVVVYVVVLVCVRVWVGSLWRSISLPLMVI